MGLGSSVRFDRVRGLPCSAHVKVGSGGGRLGFGISVCVCLGRGTVFGVAVVLVWTGWWVRMYDHPRGSWGWEHRMPLEGVAGILGGLGGFGTGEWFRSMGSDGWDSLRMPPS